jgi:hypothetical protein
MPARTIATAVIPLFRRAQQKAMHISRLRSVIAPRFVRIRPTNNGVCHLIRPALSDLLGGNRTGNASHRRSEAGGVPACQPSPGQQLQ